MNDTYTLNAKYPITGTSDFLEVSIGKPEVMPPLTREELEQSLGEHSLSEEEIVDWVERAASDTSKKVNWKITAPDFLHKGYTCGLDDLQTMLLALQAIDYTIVEWEQKTKQKCEYTFTIATKIITEIPRPNASLN